jgi:hypothetical protein
MKHHDEHDWNERHAVLYDARLSALYHRERERTYALWERLAKCAALIAGSAAVSRVLPDVFTLYLAAALTVPTLASLVFAWSDRARQHADFAVQYGEIEAAILGAGDREFSSEQRHQWQARLATLQAKEPASVKRVVLMCQSRLKAIYA